ncbi:MAG: serine/threonine protein kinase [Phycisphaerales bacterium]|nr:serine/threonine protein kinase [Phycisphaerales bacterium]MCB9863382.1 serine/threonine protein kinase [Phycisphaerales bacterium]
MTPRRWRQIEEVVHAALSCSPIARLGLLQRECGDDIALRDEVESLISASSSAGDFLETPVVILRGNPQNSPGIEVPEPSVDSIPSRLGDYRIIRRLGAGGMGIVYLAEQAIPRRHIALKVMRTVMDRPADADRFRREAEALGRLRHPGIAQVYEAGQSDHNADPRAYIAMEYVEGDTLSDFVQRRDPSVRQRLQILAQLCDSVQHAHQKGVIHRDLKPANIIVVDNGAKSQENIRTKILDFGVARIVDADDRAGTLSSSQPLVGTLPYMSPELVGDIRAGADTRSDVYALGVIGYQMLCGSLPYDIRGKAPAEIIRTISTDPPRTVGRQIPSDIQTILFKALDKDPNRRFASAAAFADDVRRFLNHMPIAARPPGVVHQLRLFSRRHRGAVFGISAAIFGLVAGTAVATWKAVQFRQERNRAVRAERMADERTRAAESAEAAARDEAETTAAVTDFLRQTLTGADPLRSNVSHATIRDALDRAAARVDSDLRDQPRPEARVRLTIGNTYRSLGLLEEARNHVQRALQLTESEFGRESLDFADVLESLGAIERDLGHHDESLSALDACFRIRAAHLAPPNACIASAQSALAATLVRMGRHEEAVELHERAIDQRRELFGYNDLDVAESLSGLAIAQRSLGRYADAEDSYRESLRLLRSLQRPDHPLIAVTLHNLGRVLNETARYAEAEEATSEAIEILRRNYKSPHPHIANFLASHADSLANLGRTVDAEAAYREALDMQRALFPDGHIDLAKTLIGLAGLPDYRLDPQKSGPLLEEAEQLAEDFGAPDDRFALTSPLVSLYLQTDALDRAEALASQRLDDMREHYGNSHATVANGHMILAEVCMRRGNLDAARANVERSLEIRRDIFGYRNPQVALCIHNLAIVHRQLGDAATAKRHFVDALERRRALLGESHPDTRDTAFQYAWLLCQTNETKTAEPILRECLRQDMMHTDKVTAVRVAETALLLQLVADASEAPGFAAEAIDAALTHATRVLGADHTYLSQIVAEIASRRSGGDSAD